MKSEDKGMEGIFFFLACCVFVAAVVVYMRREDNDYAKLLKKFESIEGTVADLQTNFTGFVTSQRNVCANITSDIGEIKGRTLDLEHRPNKMSLEITKAVPFTFFVKRPEQKAEAKTTGQGVNAVIPQGKSLLNRAGIKTKGKPEVSQ